MDDIIKTIIKSCKEIANKLHECDVSLSENSTNVNKSGDIIKNIDNYANNLIKKNLSLCKDIKALGSEEEDDIIIINPSGKYLMVFDPLDGSANVKYNISVGTIFALFEYDENIKDGNDIVMAGYCLYGFTTNIIIATDKVHIYSLDGNIISSDVKIPPTGPYYSVNDSKRHLWTDERYSNIIEVLIEYDKSLRWVGSMVADVHRTLLDGGFFAYPGNSKGEYGKIRLLYEAYPMAYIFKIANGYSSNGSISILDIPFPSDIHIATPIILSSKYEFDIFIDL